MFYHLGESRGFLEDFLESTGEIRKIMYTSQTLSEVAIYDEAFLREIRCSEEGEQGVDVVSFLCPYLPTLLREARAQRWQPVFGQTGLLFDVGVVLNVLYPSDTYAQLKPAAVEGLWPWRMRELPFSFSSEGADEDAAAGDVLVAPQGPPRPPPLPLVWLPSQVKNATEFRRRFQDRMLPTRSSDLILDLASLSAGGVLPSENIILGVGGTTPAAMQKNIARLQREVEMDSEKSPSQERVRETQQLQEQYEDQLEGTTERAGVGVGNNRTKVTVCIYNKSGDQEMATATSSAAPCAASQEPHAGDIDLDVLAHGCRWNLILHYLWRPLVGAASWIPAKWVFFVNLPTILAAEAVLLLVVVAVVCRKILRSAVFLLI